MTKIFDIVPGWVYALAIATLVALLGFNQMRLNTAQAERDTVQANYTILSAALESQKQEARTKLQAATERAELAETALQTFTTERNKTDEQNKATIADLGKRLSDLGRLRDPNAKAPRCGGSGGSTTGQAAANTGTGAGNPAEEDGLISEPLARLLRGEAGEADTLNDAFASCKATLNQWKTILDKVRSPAVIQ